MWIKKLLKKLSKITTNKNPQRKKLLKSYKQLRKTIQLKIKTELK